MNRQRKAEIRRIAYDRAARELNAAIGWELAEELFPDETERDEFEAQIARIVRQLEARAAA
jgi:hypothetical protein